MSNESDDDVDIYTLVDENQEERDFALLTFVELPEGRFAILAPAEQVDSDEESLDLYAFAYTEDEHGDPCMEAVEDEALFDRIMALAEEVLFGSEDDDPDSSEED